MSTAEVEARIEALRAELDKALDALGSDQDTEGNDSEEALALALADTRGAHGKGYRADIALFLQTGKLFQVFSFDTVRQAANACVSYRNHATKHDYNVSVAQRGSRCIITNNAKKA